MRRAAAHRTYFSTSKTRRATDDHGGTSMTTVAQLLSSKADQSFHTIEATASVFDAIKLMAYRQIGALVVTSGDQITGIVTERDYARKIVLLDRSSRETPVGDVMSKVVRHVRLNQTTDECMALMTENRIRHLPAIDGGC
jgi:IMP dehydrogenase